MYKRQVSGYVIACSDASALHSRLTSVSRTANSCTYTITPSTAATAGNATFSITFTSDGGDSRSGTITVEIGPDSTISYTGPTGLKVGRNRTLEIDVTEYATEANPSSYDISCGDATGVDSTRLSSVSHTGSSCTFTVDPIDALGSSLQGDTTFTIPHSDPNTPNLSLIHI